MTQSWNPTVYAETGAFVPALGAGVLEWLAPKAGESTLDQILRTPLLHVQPPTGRILRFPVEAYRQPVRA